jgi:aspartyl-tRNA(Asn)/glutamyl-tRNA(Gln) amidotransferase subunit A
MDIHSITITSALQGLYEKKFSSLDLTKACLEQIEKHNGVINAFITVSKSEALEAAETADKKIENGEKAPLLGIPVALKDIFVTKGIQTTAASNVLKGYIPQYDGTVVTKLKDAGAVLIGKTNCDAWAHGSSGENSDFGATKNPYNIDYVPGGSSSGSPAAVAASMERTQVALFAFQLALRILSGLSPPMVVLVAMGLSLWHLHWIVSVILRKR